MITLAPMATASGTILPVLWVPRPLKDETVLEYLLLEPTLMAL